MAIAEILTYCGGIPGVEKTGDMVVSCRPDGIRIDPGTFKKKIEIPFENVGKISLQCKKSTVCAGLPGRDARTASHQAPDRPPRPAVPYKSIPDNKDAASPTINAIKTLQNTFSRHWISRL